MLRPFAHPVARCWMLLRVVAQSLKPVKPFSQQLPTFLLFRDRRSVAQQCWIRLHSSSNIVGAAYAYYAWFTKTYGLYPSHDALLVPTLLGVVASVCAQPYPRSQAVFSCFLLFTRSTLSECLAYVAGVRRERKMRFWAREKRKGRARMEENPSFLARPSRFSRAQNLLYLPLRTPTTQATERLEEAKNLKARVGSLEPPFIIVNLRAFLRVLQFSPFHIH